MGTIKAHGSMVLPAYVLQGRIYISESNSVYITSMTIESLRGESFGEATVRMVVSCNL